MSDAVEARLSVVEYKVDELYKTVCAMDGKLDGIIMERERWRPVLGGISGMGKIILGVVIGVVVPWILAVIASGIVSAIPASAP